jgi:hypothetical protein
MFIIYVFTNTQLTIIWIKRFKVIFTSTRMIIKNTPEYH